MPTEEQDIHNTLATPTEVKTPGSSQAFTWNFDDSPEATESVENASIPASSDGKKVISEEERRNSAETTVIMADQLVQLIANMRINAKFKNKFTEQERTTIMEKDLEFADPNKLEEADRLLKTKWDTYLRRRDRKMEKIPLDKNEMRRYVDAVYQYYKVKNMTMPPEYLLLFNVAQHLIDRAIETEFD